MPSHELIYVSNAHCEDFQPQGTDATQMSHRRRLDAKRSFNFTMRTGHLAKRMFGAVKQF